MQTAPRLVVAIVVGVMSLNATNLAFAQSRRSLSVGGAERVAPDQASRIVTMSPHVTPYMPEQEPWTTPVLEVAGNLAFASHLGVIGAEISINATRWFAVRGGIGGAPKGPHAAFMLALRHPFEHHSIGITTGLSWQSAYQAPRFARLFPHSGPPNPEWRNVTWWNWQLFVDEQRRRTVGRGYIGVGIPLSARRGPRAEGHPPLVLLLGGSFGFIR